MGMLATIAKIRLDLSPSNVSRRLDLAGQSRRVYNVFKEVARSAASAPGAMKKNETELIVRPAQVTNYVCVPPGAKFFPVETNTISGWRFLTSHSTVENADG